MLFWIGGKGFDVFPVEKSDIIISPPPPPHLPALFSVCVNSATFVFYFQKAHAPFRPNITLMVDWELKINSVHPVASSHRTAR